MLNYKDILKANIRYLIVIIITTLVGVAIAYGLSNTDKSYLAKSTLLVEKNDTVGENEYITQQYADTVIKEMEMLIQHRFFASKIIEEVAKIDPAFANTLTIDTIQNNMKVVYTQGNMFFNITVSDLDKVHAMELANAATEVAKKEYNDKTGTKAKLSQVYNTELFTVRSNNFKHYILGALLGFAAGEFLVILFIFTNPFVEDRDILKTMSGLEIIATLEKEKVKV